MEVAQIISIVDKQELLRLLNLSELEPRLFAEDVDIFTMDDAINILQRLFEQADQNIVQNSFIKMHSWENENRPGHLAFMLIEEEGENAEDDPLIMTDFSMIDQSLKEMNHIRYTFGNRILIFYRYYEGSYVRVKSYYGTVDEIPRNILILFDPLKDGV